MTVILMALACVDDRALLTVPVATSTSASELSPADGVTVTLTRAELTLSDLRMEGPATTALRWAPPRLIATAHAHPGHDFAGQVGGELVGTWTLDLLAAPVDLGAASCYTGAYATARLNLEPSPGVTLEGVATTLGGDVPFRFVVEPDQEVTGVPFEVVLDEAAPPEGVTLAVDLEHALSFVDWATPDTDGDGALTTADGSLANTVLFGVVATPTFTLNLEQ